MNKTTYGMFKKSICFVYIMNMNIATLFIASDNTLEDNECTLIIHNSMIHVTRKPVFRSSNQIKLEPACSATEAI